MRSKGRKGLSRHTNVTTMAKSTFVLQEAEACESSCNKGPHVLAHQGSGDSDPDTDVSFESFGPGGGGTIRVSKLP